MSEKILKQHRNATAITYHTTPPFANGQNKAETCANLSAILPQIKDSDTKQIVSTTLKKLNALSEETCTELTATTKRRKITERDHSIKTRLAKAKEQSKQPTVTEGKKHRSHTKAKGDMEL